MPSLGLALEIFDNCQKIDKLKMNSHKKKIADKNNLLMEKFVYLFDPQRYDEMKNYFQKDA